MKILTRSGLLHREIGYSHFLLVITLYFMVFHNSTFFQKALSIYPINEGYVGFNISLFLVFGALNLAILALFSGRYTTKPFIITILLITSVSSYYMNTYQTVISESMLDNILHTDPAETADLLSIKLLLYFLILGVIPAYIVYKTKILYPSSWGSIMSRIRILLIATVSITSLLYIYYDYYSSFFKEHREVHHYSNPGYYIYSSLSYAYKGYRDRPQELSLIGHDAKTPQTDKYRELVILVIGETARSDRFSLNGYHRETNPVLKKKDIISYSNFWSCDTSTERSLPCMFSNFTEKHYDRHKARNTENVLDVLKRVGVNVLWLDNNSSSKGVAGRVEYINYRTDRVNPVCNPECRDVGMISHLQQYIDEHPKGDIFIVLHQMGQHGPAYYKRYPAEFEKFTPVCRSNQLEQCSQETINNAYDNAILYTDYFLGQVIDLLEKNDPHFETAMLYVSDHGESLGEHGLYLHGLPKMIAPDEQRHVPAILWLGKNMRKIYNFEKLKDKSAQRFTHDFLFHTILGFMEIESSVYNKSLDLLKYNHFSPKQ